MAIIGNIGNATDGWSINKNVSSGGSIGGGSSDNWSNSFGGTYGTGATASAFSHQMMEEANAFNAEQARLNRAWQEKMSNTAYQRAMQDLRKAGLNPILAYSNGGASVGSGATASSAMGSAYTDTYNESQSHGHSAEYNKSWNDSDGFGYESTTSNLANQIGTISGQVAGVIEQLMHGLGDKNYNAAEGLHIYQADLGYAAGKKARNYISNKIGKYLNK